MLRKLVILALVAAVIGLAAFWFLTIPGKVEASGALIDRPDPIFPVVAGNEVAARIADDRDPEIANETQDILPKSEFVRRWVAWLINSAIDRASEVFEECPKQPIIDVADAKILVENNVGRLHAC